MLDADGRMKGIVTFDDIAVVRSMFTEQINHDPAHTFMNTGSLVSGRPSMGSWISYGLGTENANLPSYITIHPVSGPEVANAMMIVKDGRIAAIHDGFRSAPAGAKVLADARAGKSAAALRRCV